MKKNLFFFILIILNLSAFAQTVRHCQINDLFWHEKCTSTDSGHTSIRKQYFEYFYNIENQFKTNKIFKTNSFILGKENISKNDSLKKFLCVNPIINSLFTYNYEEAKIQNDFKIGFSTFGTFKNKINFNSDLYFGNISFPENIEDLIDSTKIIPFHGNFFNDKNKNYSYFDISGYFNYSPSEYINFEIGKGKNFWGEGYRSLFLSDNSNSYPFFKTSVDVWKLQYIYMISKFKDFNSDLRNNNLDHKYSVEHYLSVNLFDFININLFEVVIASPIDEIGAKRGLDVNYLNPMIFMRPVESSIGSADNVLMGVGGSLKILKKHFFYGQFIIDEFVISELKAKSGWWGNKFGIQAGIKSYKAFLISNLFAQLEINYIRPYTYSHQNSIRNWGNYAQPMAHPLGANLKEIVAIGRYKIDNIYISAKAIYSSYGTNLDSLTVGQNIYLSYNDRIGDFDNYVGQGEVNNVIYGELKASYLLIYNWNLFFETSIIFRQHQYGNLKNKNIYATIGFKTLLFNENNEY